MLVQRTTIIAGLTVMIFVAGMVGASQAWASEVGSAVLLAHTYLKSNGVLLTDDELSEVTGEGWELLAVVVLTYAIEKALEYAGAEEWLMETAFPAIESAGVWLYETVADAVTHAMEVHGEFVSQPHYALEY